MENIFNNIDFNIINKGKKYAYTGIEYDSRKIKEGNIFVAIPGYSVDGHDYIKNALTNGAKLIIVSKDVEIIDRSVTYVKVGDTDSALGIIASNFYNYPQNELTIIGVTGTNGKTTITYLLEEIMDNIAKIGTVEYKVGKEIFEAPNTTPMSLDIIKICNRAREKNIKYLIMEVSSHALELGRVDNLLFDIGIFTNLSQDHLDFHKNMNNYFDAKLKLFDKLGDKKKGIVNIDDVWGQKIYKKYNKFMTYSTNNGDISGEILEYYSEGMEIKLKYKEENYIFKTKLMGKFNLYNIMAACGCGILLGLEMNRIVEKIKNANTVPGRFELINEGQDFLVVVDYAHTDAGLINILGALRDINGNKLITIFGAGGDRDKTKRAKMAQAAAKYSDKIIITSDNPRTENAESILDDVEEGLKEINYNKKNYIKIIKREEAIKNGIDMAEKGDIVLIAGKGHETYQIIGKKKFPFDDREIARKMIRNICKK